VAKQSTRTSRLSLESLADRVVPSVSVLNGEITIRGTPGPDSVKVTEEFVQTGSYWETVATVTGDGGISSGYASEFGSYEVKVVEKADGYEYTTWIPLGQVSGRVVFYGFGGDDTFENDTGLQTTAYGFEGNDILIGGWGSDTLLGGDGIDYLFGNAGNDTLDGGTDTARNYLWGGAGDDTMYGANGSDYMYGEDGLDTLYGRDGSDHLDGGDDMIHDRLYGGRGKDYFQIDWGDGSWGQKGFDRSLDDSSSDVYYEV
jgi:Ca2+-binding RTX toxin-like protein